MTDADKLRALAHWFENPDDEINLTWQEAPVILRRIADLLDAVPPETLEAIKAGTWRAIPKVPSRELLQKAGCSAGDYHALLAAAPTKPEEREDD